MYRTIHLFTHKRKFLPEIVPPWLKNRNQRVHAEERMRGGGEAVYRSVKEKADLSEGNIRGGGGRGREIRYKDNKIQERVKAVWLLLSGSVLDHLLTWKFLNILLRL